MADEKEDPKGKEKEEGAEKAEGAEGGEGGAAAAPAKKALSKKLIIIIAAVGLVVVGGGVGGALYFTSAKKEAALTEQKDKEKEKEKPKAAEGEGAEGEKKAKVAFFSLGDLLVNLSGEGKRPNYLKVKISLELADEKDAAMMESLKPRIIDNFQAYLRELRIEDLRGSAGLYRLREALLLRVTEAVQPIRVRDVLFQEMLVQ